MSIFDTSIVNVNDERITKDAYVKELVPKICVILKKFFPESPQRQKVKVFKDRIAFAAPCCGDSAHDNSKKRGNIILEGKFKGLYKCHNCGTCMSVPAFFKRYGQTLSMEAIDYALDQTSTFEKKPHIHAPNRFYDIESIEKYAIDRELFKKNFSLEECFLYNEAYVYLNSRMQRSFEKFLYSPHYKLLFILNLTPNGKIFGMQVRHLDKSYKGPKYKTYNLSKIYSTFLHNNVVVPDDFDSLSMIFNILLVNCDEPVTVLEGPMDSFLVDNAIALCGAGKHMVFPFRCRYMFDDDETGRKHAMEYIVKGGEVFLWEKYRRKNKVPSRKKWDMNDIILWATANGVTLTNIDECFSKDALDIMDI